MSKFSLIFAGATGIATIMAVYFWHQISVERGLNRQMHSRVTQLERDQLYARYVAADPQGAAVSAQMRDSALADMSKQNATMPAPLGESPVALNAGQMTSINMSDLLTDPKFRKAQHTQVRLQMPQNYPDVAKELGLSPAEAEEFFDLLAKQQINRMVLTATSAADAKDTGMKEQRNLGNVVRKDQADIAEWLGPTRSQAWQEYQQSLGARKQVGQLRTTLSAAGYPLTDAQVGPLLATITSEQQRLNDTNRYPQYSPDPRAQMEYDKNSLEAMEESNERILGVARSYLDPRQLSALESLMVQRMVMSRAVTKARRAHFESTGVSSATSP